MDKSAEIVNRLEDCNMVIMQQGWSRSRYAVMEWNRASMELNIPCREGYLYTDAFYASVARA